MLSFFGNYLYVKILRHWIFPSRDIDDQKSCNLIWQEHVLVNHLNVYEIHNKKTPPFPLRVQLIFHSALPLIWSNHPQTKFTPGKSSYVWGWLGIHSHTKPALVVLHAVFPWLLSLDKKFKTMVVSFKRYWWSQNPVIWLHNCTFWSYT